MKYRCIKTVNCLENWFNFQKDSGLKFTEGKQYRKVSKKYKNMNQTEKVKKKRNSEGNFNNFPTAYKT